MRKNNYKDISWSFLLENYNFFNQLFSTYYAFNETMLIKYKNLLSIGKGSLSVDSGSIISSITFGLIFNQNINWNEGLIEHFRKSPVLIYTGGGYDEYDFIIDYNKLPYDISEELDSYKLLINEEAFIGESGYYDKEKYENWFNYLFEKEEFSVIDINDILFSFEPQLFIANKHIYNSCEKIIKEKIPDFTINDFYSNYTLENSKR